MSGSDFGKWASYLVSGSDIGTAGKSAYDIHRSRTAPHTTSTVWEDTSPNLLMWYSDLWLL